jgi:signal transduction histidine kinase
LAIARNVIVKKHGATLSFETHPGAGTTFLIQLPINGKQTREHVDEEMPVNL